MADDKTENKTEKEEKTKDASKSETSKKDKLKYKFEKGWTIGCNWANYKGGDFSKFKDFAKLLNDDLSAVEYRLASFDINVSDGTKYHVFYMTGYKAWGFDVYDETGKISKKLVSDDIKETILQKADIKCSGETYPFSKIAETVCRWIKRAEDALPKIEPLIIDGTISVDENKFELLKKIITNPSTISSIKQLKFV